MPIDPQDALPCACSRSRDVLGPEEEEVLRRMRALRAQARVLRQHLTTPAAEGSTPREEARAHLDGLREAFAECRRELERANELKLRRLGHIR